MKQQQGFTLIELIVVIIVLGILAATAMPKFSNLSVDARIAKMNAVAGSLRGATALVNGQLVAEGGASGTMATPGTVTLPDGTVINTVWGYPAASVPGGIGSAIDMSGLSSGPAAISNVAGAFVTNNSAYGITFAPDSVHPNCIVQYYFAALNKPPTISSVMVDSVASSALALANCS